MKNTDNTYLKKRESKKDKEIKKYKRRARALFIFLLIVGGVALVQIVQNMFQNVKSDPTGNLVVNYINESILNKTGTVTTVNQDDSLTHSISKGISTFMDKLFSYPGSFWTKLFIFLGIVYLIQVIFSLIFDVIELILLAFVAVKRLVVWIYKKITRKESKRDEQIEKIAKL